MGPGGIESTAPVGEHEPGGVVGVTPDMEPLEVEHAVVGGAQGDEIVRVGWPAVLPMHQVVDVQPPLSGATGHPATAVAILDEDAQERRNRASSPPESDRTPEAFDDRSNGGVAGDVIGQRLGQHRPQMHPWFDPAVAVDVDHHLEPLTRRGAIESVEPGGSESGQGVTP